jgi:uncharacterized protein
MSNVPKRYVNPYLSGLVLGVVLFGALFVMGRGLGASGAMMKTAANATHAVAPALTEGNEYLSQYAGKSLLDDWLFLQVIGVAIGALLSAALGRRMKWEILRGPRMGAAARLGLALLGGGVFGFGARLARGCTSGLALSGGATLALGSMLGMMCIFAGAYALAYFLRRQWI